MSVIVELCLKIILSKCLGYAIICASAIGMYYCLHMSNYKTVDIFVSCNHFDEIL